MGYQKLFKSREQQFSTPRLSIISATLTYLTTSGKIANESQLPNNKFLMILLHS